MQVRDYIPAKWKCMIKKTYEYAANLVTHDHHLIKGSKVITLDKLTLSEISSILILKVQNKPSRDIYFENLLNDNDIDGAAIYMLPCLATHNTFK